MRITKVVMLIICLLPAAAVRAEIVYKPDNASPAFSKHAVAVLDDQSQLVWIDVQRVDDRARLPGRCFEEFSKLVEGIVAVTVELMEFAMEATRQPDAVFGDEAELRISVIRI